MNKKISDDLKMTNVRCDKCFKFMYTDKDNNLICVNCDYNKNNSNKINTK